MAAPVRKFGVEAFQEAFDASGDPARQKAFARFAETGLPHHKIEAWKYTSLVHLARTAFQPAPANFELNGALPARLGDAARVVFVNGRYSGMLSDAPVAGFAAQAHAKTPVTLGDEANDDPMLALTAGVAWAYAWVERRLASPGRVVPVSRQALAGRAAWGWWSLSLLTWLLLCGAPLLALLVQGVHAAVWGQGASV